jgi:hypothetical protein
MVFSDLELAKRLERAEGYGCAQHALARARTSPGRGAEVMAAGEGFAAFDGIDSPVTQCFGLGVLHPLTGETLNEVERFFFDRGAAADLEVSPLAGVAALRLLCERGYRPIETASVMYRDVQIPSGEDPPGARARLIEPGEARLWADVCVDGWTQELLGVRDLLAGFAELIVVKEGSACFLGELEGTPAAAGSLVICEGVALFSGAATIPQMRRRGLQAALLRERMRYAAARGCDLAMMVTEPGSTSQKNAERQGFRIAYTRTKWRRARQTATDSAETNLRAS